MQLRGGHGDMSRIKKKQTTATENRKSSLCQLCLRHSWHHDNSRLSVSWQFSITITTFLVLWQYKLRRSWHHDNFQFWWPIQTYAQFILSCFCSAQADFTILFSMKLNEILHGAHESIPKNRHYRRPFYWHDLTLIPTWISYVIHDNVLDEITVHRWNLEIDK